MNKEGVEIIAGKDEKALEAVSKQPSSESSKPSEASEPFLVVTTNLVAAPPPKIISSQLSEPMKKEPAYLAFLP